MNKRVENISIRADRGSIVGGINIKSNGAAAQTGHSNEANLRYVAYQRVVEALRTDALATEGLEAAAAQNNADDLEEAAAAQDRPRIDRVLGRINSLLSTASSAFALTREATNLLG
ncbi:hypothetical protein [Streptomyces hundungensis]|uniref:hypothetical protein n=1 Tax=Streptomyces hundungensis TaxID=1077946 RepID=UPI0033D075C9